MFELKYSGSPQDFGYAHGDTFKKEIHELYAIRSTLLRNYKANLSDSEILKIVNPGIETLKKHRDLYVEFQAISKASELEEWKLFVLNNYTDLRDFFGTDNEDEGCTVFAVKNKAGMFSGQTWDMHGSATPYILSMDFNGQKILTVTGCLGLAGVNSSSLAIYINNVHGLERNSKGLMWPGLVRLMLDDSSSGEAAETLKKSLPSSAHNYLIVDNSTAINIEATSDRWVVTGRIDGVEGFLFHTNHFVDTNLMKIENMDRQSKTTLKRYEAMKNLSLDGQWKSQNLIEIKENILNGEVGEVICIPPSLENPHAGVTCGGVCYEHQSDRLDIFKGHKYQ